MKKTFLAFDLGASSGRGILGTFSQGKLELEEIHRFENGPLDADGALHWDLPAIFNEIKTGIKKAVAKCSSLAGIAVDTWGVDYALLGKDGDFVRLPYNYRDSRTEGVLDNFFSETMSEQEVYSITGIQKMFFNTLPQLIAHKNQHPEDLAGSRILLMPDAITYLLCGNAACEYTDASTTQLINAATRQWDFNLIRKAGLPESLFPEIVPPCTHAGTLLASLQQELGCQPIPVLRVGSHDTASAVAAVPASGSSDWAYISCGTWALIGAEADSPCLTPQAMKACFTNEGGLNNKIRLLTNINGTWLLQQTRNTWRDAGKSISFIDMEKMASSSPKGRFIVNPNDQRFMAPGDMPQRIRQACQESGQGSLPDDSALVRCIYDSLANCFKLKLEELEKIRNAKFKVMHIVGGATKDKLLMQLSADSLGIPVVAGPVEATAIGNLIAQAIASGLVRDLDQGRDIVRISFPVVQYSPSP